MGGLVGTVLGCIVGGGVGAIVGERVGRRVGLLVGERVGLGVCAWTSRTTFDDDGGSIQKATTVTGTRVTSTPTSHPCSDKTEGWRDTINHGIY